MQHMPSSVLNKACSELNRVVCEEFFMEFHNLNPAFFYRCIYRLFGKRRHTRGSIGPWETNLLSAKEWLDFFQTFRSGRFQASIGYSELFFHPDLHLSVRPYPVRLEKWVDRWLSGLASFFARQVRLRINGRPND